MIHLALVLVWDYITKTSQETGLATAVLHSLPGDALKLGVKTNAAHVDNGNELSMGADTPDCPTGSTVMAGMGAGKTCS